MRSLNTPDVPPSSTPVSFAVFSLLGLALLNACSSDNTSTVFDLYGAPTAPKILIVAGDIAQCPTSGPTGTAAAKTADLVKSLLTRYGDEAQVLTLGDNVYSRGSSQEFADCYEPTWGAFKLRTLPTPGNHDYGQPDASGYFDYFGLAAGLDRKGYYIKQVANWSVVSLNSNIPTGVNSEQLQWLRSASFSNCKIAAWHHPLFTSAQRGSNLFMKPVWEQLDVAQFDLVLQGHEHHYERFAPKKADGSLSTGIRSFVVGTGGASLSPFNVPIEGSEIRISSFGVVVLKLYDNRYEWEFIDPEKKVLDSGSAACRT